MAVVTFGGAYAVLAYVAQQAVNLSLGHARRNARRLGMAETTPGPLIMVLQFVGFMAAFRAPGLFPPLAGRRPGRSARDLGDLHALLLMDLPGAPYIEAAPGQALSRRLSAITAAVVGVILNLAIWFAIHTVFRATVVVGEYGLSFDAPVLSSVDLWSLALSVAARERHLPLPRRHPGSVGGLLSGWNGASLLGAFSTMQPKEKAMKTGAHRPRHSSDCSLQMRLLRGNELVAS